ncbi:MULTISPECIES: DHA2 family efflux MFS transporter permease subunit [Enterococcus]|uniref:DHA2 family efflux MFS transporter permease subunit n=1 Tax=Enterococcus sp. AZ103 TaxID=2774628 RepID=UPI003F21E7C9
MLNVTNTYTKTVKHKWWVLTILALSVSLVIIDGTIVNVSLPVIMKDLKLSFTNAEWIITLYSLLFSSLLITMGRLADNFGRKKILIIGIIIFLFGSILASFSKDITFMLTARAIQGVGGASILPTTLSVVNSLFFGKDRTVAFAVWGSVIAGMAAIGPLLGGYLTTYLSWHWIFWINFPIGVFIIISALKYLPETYGEKIVGKFDFIGFLLSTISLISFVFGVIEGRTYGWWHANNGYPTFFNLSIIPTLIAIGILVFSLFIVWESRLNKQNKSHLLDVSLFKFKSFSLGNIIAGIVAIGESGLLFLLPLFLQNILVLSPIKSGIILSVMGLGAFLAGGMATFIVEKTSASFVVSLGLFLETLGFFGFFKTVNPNNSLAWIVIWLIIYGIGLGFASAQLTSIVLKDVPPIQSGQGSSIQSTTRQIGSALGVAIIGTIFNSKLQNDIPHTLDGLGISAKMQHSLESSVINSAGSAIHALKVSNPKILNITETMRNNMVVKLDINFTNSLVKTIGISSIVILISFFLTFGLYKQKNN